MTKVVAIPGVPKHVEDLILWRNPSRTGIVFGAINLAYMLLAWSNWNFISILANLVVLTVLGTFVWANVAHFINRPGVPMPAVLNGVSDSQVKSYAEKATVYVNKTLAFVRRVWTGQEPVLTGQVAGAAYLVAKVSSWFSLLGFGYMVALLAFSVPKLYEYKKDEIDDLLHKANVEGKKVHDQYLEPYLRKIPRASTAKSSPLSNTGSTANPNGSTADSVFSAEPKKEM